MNTREVLVKIRKVIMGVAALASAASLALLGALPAQALTVGTNVIKFDADDIEYSAVSPDGSIIAYSSSSDDVLLQDVAAGTIEVVDDSFENFSSPGGVVFSPDGATLYVANYDNGDIAVVDVATATVTDTLTTSDLTGPWPIAISPDGTTLYIGEYTQDKLVTMDISLETSQSAGSVSDPYFLYVTSDGSTVYSLDYYGQIDVMDTSDPTTIPDSWTNLSGYYYGACVSPNETTLYTPDYSNDILYAVSLVDGTIIEQVDLPNSGNAYCAVAPDGSSVFVTNWNEGDQDSGDPDSVRAPGIVQEFDPSTLAFIKSYDTTGVAYTQPINFVDVCDAWVAGYYGNAVKLTLDSGMCAPALPDTGASQTMIITLSSVGGGLLVLGAVALVLVRRRSAQV